MASLSQQWERPHNIVSKPTYLASEVILPIPLSDQEIIDYHDALHYTWNEIGAMFGVSGNAARMRHRKAKVRLAKETPEDTPSYDGLTIDELLAHAENQQILLNKVDPVITNLELTFKGNKPLVTALAGCFQSGGRWTRDRKIRDYLDDAMARGLKLFSLGDEIEGFLSGTFAGAQSQHEQALPLPLQLALFRKYLDTIRAAVLCGTSSQHGGQWFERGVGLNPLKDEYLRRNIPYFDATGYLKIHVGKQTYNVAISHEFPGSSMVNPNHPQRRALWQRFPSADMIAMADRHQFSIQQLDVYGNEVEAGNRPSPEVWLVQVGTAKVGPDRYTMRGWERGAFGWPYAIFFHDRHKVVVTRDYEVVEAYL